jgi:hypothetical protein
LQKNIEDFTELIKEEHTLLLMDGRFVKDRDLNALEINAGLGGIGMMNWILFKEWITSDLMDI